jgi:hypothetical protein
MEKKILPFGKRFGFESSELKIQIDSMDNDLKTDLYNSYLIYIHEQIEHTEHSENDYRRQHRLIWVHYLRQPLDKFPSYDYMFRDRINSQIVNQPWYKTYELFEFLFKTLDGRLYKLDSFKNYINLMLERNNSAYRVVESMFVPISNNQEIEEVGKAKANAKSSGIMGFGEHLASAVMLLSKKPSPDYRNSIKESISMVEAICRTIEPSENTLGKALNKIEAKGKLNAVLKTSFEKL